MLFFNKKNRKPAVSRVPKRSPIQVFTGPGVDLLPGTDQTGYVLRLLCCKDKKNSYIYIITNRSSVQEH